MEFISPAEICMSSHVCVITCSFGCCFAGVPSVISMCVQNCLVSLRLFAYCALVCLLCSFCVLASREGIFDWMLARQLKDWNFTRRFVREYSGMSLRGLVWTLPQGYALQQFGFGWQYSLSGSLMGAVYYAGAESKFEPNNTDFFDSTIAHSEFYWGTFMWFVLIITCLSQLVYRTRRWVYHRSPSSVHNPYTRWEILKHVSLNYRWMRVCYEALVVLLWTVFTISIIFYSVTVQTDASNKGMTFAGLFLSVVALTFFLAWTWAIVYITHVFRRARQEERRIEIEKSKQSRTAPGINDIDHLEGGSGMGDRMSYTGEGDPLLPWPYSHPDKIFAKRTHSPVEQSRLSAGSSYGTYSQHSSVRQPPNGSTGLAFILLWPGIEKWLYLDIFSWLRHLIGLVSLCATMGTLLLTLITFFWNLKVFRFNPYYEVCPVSANITQIGT